MKLRPAFFLFGVLGVATFFAVAVAFEERGQAAAASARQHNRGIQKFLSAPVPEFLTSRIGPQKTRVETAESGLQTQIEKVEDARLKMMDVMKKYNIVDMVPVAGGQNFSSVPPPAISMMEEARKYQNTMEQEVRKLTTRLETLANLKGEQLVVGFLELNVQNSTVTKDYPEYQTEMAQLESAAANGLGEDDPGIMALRESTQAKLAQMESVVENYKASLKLNIDNAKRLLEEAKTFAHGPPADPVAQREKQNKYATAKYNYESQLLLLSTMKERASQVEAQTSSLPPGK